MQLGSLIHSFHFSSSFISGVGVRFYYYKVLTTKNLVWNWPIICKILPIPSTEPTDSTTEPIQESTFHKQLESVFFTAPSHQCKKSCLQHTHPIILHSTPSLSPSASPACTFPSTASQWLWQTSYGWRRDWFPSSSQTLALCWDCVHRSIDCWSRGTICGLPLVVAPPINI